MQEITTLEAEIAQLQTERNQAKRIHDEQEVATREMRKQLSAHVRDLSARQKKLYTLVSPPHRHACIYIYIYTHVLVLLDMHVIVYRRQS